MAVPDRSHRYDPAPADDAERAQDVIDQAFAVVWTSLLGLPGFPPADVTPARGGPGGARGRLRTVRRRARR